MARTAFKVPVKGISKGSGHGKGRKGHNKKMHRVKNRGHGR